MKIRHKSGGLPEKVEQNMTPMIDVVFQLLSFFMFTLRISEVEGNFDIKMPSASRATNTIRSTPPVKVRLTAKADGTLAQLFYNGKPLGDFAALRSQIVSLVGNDQAVKEATEVELDCDYHLHYTHVIDAITHVSGYVTDDGQSTVKLVEKIKFLPPKPPGRQ
jgi:biopolymer transport protein ExbD